MRFCFIYHTALFLCIYNLRNLVYCTKNENEAEYVFTCQMSLDFSLQ